MLMRVAIGIHREDLDAVLETYTLLSEKWFTHASPTLFNAGTCRPQLSSCFLLSMKEDSIDVGGLCTSHFTSLCSVMTPTPPHRPLQGIYDTLKQCACISKSAGGIGVAVHCIRARGSYIAGVSQPHRDHLCRWNVTECSFLPPQTNGTSNGLVPMLRVFNNTARYVDQGGNKRPGAFAMYLEPWHADVFDFLDLRKNTGKEEQVCVWVCMHASVHVGCRLEISCACVWPWLSQRARDLFYGLWIPDLFMKRVEADKEWSLMCPHECPGLHEVWGEEFEQLYERCGSIVCLLAPVPPALALPPCAGL